MNNTSTETYTSRNSLTNTTTCTEPITASTIMSPEVISLLQKAIERNIIDVDEVLHQEEEMTKKEILEQHKFAIKYNEKDNRWHTYVPDETKPHGRRPVAKRNKEDLDKFLVDFYKATEEKAVAKTFKLAFDSAVKRKIEYVKNPEKLISKKNTSKKHDSEYRRFIAGTAIENKRIEQITKEDIEEICLFNLKRYDLKKKGFDSLRGILKMTLDYAYGKYWTTDNVFHRVDFSIFDDMLEAVTPIESRVHTQEEVSAIINELHRVQEFRPKASSSWALEMQLLMGSRRGEIPPLEYSDLTDDGISIHKEQLMDDNKCVIVNHTKTGQNRKFPLSDDLIDFLARLKARNDKYYPDCKYLFPNPDQTAPITGNALYMEYRNTCKRLGIQIDKTIRKGPHSFRRNAITDVVNAANGNTILTASLFGNSPEVIRKHYYTGVDHTSAKEIINKRRLITE